MKTRNLIVFSIIALIVGISSCRDDFDFDAASDNLSFSTDTLNLDTIFNHTNSQTYKLTIHNNQDKDVVIPRIYLTNGESSLFKINVDGMAGYDFENIAVRKDDSIFIFVEIGAGEVINNSLYEDEINFETTNANQHVKLLSYLEKAIFHTEDQPIGSQNWDSEWSHVIFGNQTAENLNIGPGTKVYFHNAANLTINGSLNVVGNLDNKVIFRTDRMDDRSDSIPNTWGKIHLKPNSNSSIEYAIIKGGNRGLEVENADLDIKNSFVLNNEEFGIYSHGNLSNINGNNLVVNNSNQASIKIEGGNYDFRHCTIANFHNIGQGAGDNVSLWVKGSNSGGFYNSIFYGRAMDAIYLEDASGNLNFNSNIIRGTAPNNSTNGLDEDPMFVNSGFGANDLRLLQKEDSEIPGHASASNLNTETNSDILNISRTDNLNNLTPGAYQVLVDPETLD
ncbi:hypothetical protein [Moheibacter lacus]|uniref:Right handed beta helix region n=1 Tax=Moheibacter lacus TaxID=2745851 RepID=A0A838ZTY2_9FLAO|nr:hypothetical protein [Moheibacter lacus]MBA5630422.1 hypothetical protein [Moheibacter lacus]